MVNRNKHRVGIIREEGSNSDKEMAAAFFASYCNVIDINTYDFEFDPISEYSGDFSWMELGSLQI